ncbi:hypothetical protein [Gallalistipes aquisgranensis]|uniref:hypothetical protein n=1 Tax=Gallalistipes aquisgranensis TaxID=2779358 RepID=UPI001CF884B6|nr:hypothetical protein [Gallalistipes aquisgranensis]MBE5034601.1 hypothetical protein [Gallalistipes aquisgranensis]
MKRTTAFPLLLACLLAGFSAFSQNLGAFKTKLAQPDSLHRSRVTVYEEESAAQVLRAMQRTVTGEEKYRGYRVRIFFDNSQSARTLAAGTLTRFRELHPDTPAYMVYENPYFKVTVGNCLSLEEAIILWGRIKGDFDRAFVVREEFPVKLLGE